ncbi:hypothetical protein Aperf_G00000125772 [Anoplocephala perfoliata]
MEVGIDCTEVFKKYLGSMRFSTYDSFNKALGVFQNTTQTYYKQTNSAYFPPESVERHLLCYKYIRFACEQHKKSDFRSGIDLPKISCPAYFTVGSRNSQLGVVKYHMAHNHKGYRCVELPETCTMEEDESTVADVDCTSAFLALFKDKVFDSYAELQAKMEEFQHITGSLYGKRNTKRFPEDSAFASTLVYKSFAYECYHYGTHNSDNAFFRARRSAKIGCRSRITVSCFQNKLRIVQFNLKHNHDVAPEHAKAYPRNRRLNPSQLAIVKKMLRNNCDVHAVKEFISDTFGTPCTLSDIRNIKNKLSAPVRNEALSAASFAVETAPELDQGSADLPHNLSTTVQQDASLDDMIVQLTPQLEHIHNLVLSSSSQDIMESRMKCLNRLIEFWQEGKEAMVLVPARRVILRSNPDAESSKSELQREQHPPPFVPPQYVRVIHLENSSNACLGVRDNVDDDVVDDFYQPVTRPENFAP